MLVDPVLAGVNGYLAALERHGLRLRYVVDTHLHGDHISGAAALTERAGAAYVMHEASAAPGVDIRVDEGDALHVGDVWVEILHTPGPRPESVTLQLPDRILTGDLIHRPVALLEGDAGAEGAARHWASLQRLAELPADLLVFPAHGDGAGATLGDERRRNPWLAPRTRDEHLAWLSTLAPARSGAPWMPEARLPAASAGNVNATAVPSVTVAELAEMLRRERVTVVDVREPDEVAGPQVPIAGALTIPLAELPARLSELAGCEHEPVVVVCRSGSRSATGAAILLVAGFERAYSLEGGMRQWRAPGRAAT